MPGASEQPATEYFEIEHPWVSHQHVPIYEWTFPTEPSNDELDAFVHAREEWAKRTDALEWAQVQLDAKVAECRAHSRVRARG